MRIVQVHNYYQFAGGEDCVLENEKELLISRGHTVLQFTKNNADINGLSPLRKMQLFFDVSFSKKTYHELYDFLSTHKPDICHVHNTLALITPAVYYCCRSLNIPVVQTLHNYRLLCTADTLCRNEEICEVCIGRSLYNSVGYGCYRGSKLQTLSLASAIETHKKRGVWKEYIHAYIMLTTLARKKFIEGGLPEDRMYLKPNFLSSDPGVSGEDDGYFLFAGRLEKTKGIHILLDALPGNDFNVLVAGNGTMKERIQEKLHERYLGQRQHHELINLIRKCSSVIFPSIWYEGMPMTIIEAFACGKPVIASNLGAMSAMIDDGKTGLLFEPGNPTDLAEKLRWAKSNPERIRKMGVNARKTFEQKYTADRNYDILMDIYSHAIENARLQLAN